MRDKKIGKRYAESIFLVGESKGNLVEIYQALNSLMEVYETDKDFKNFLSHPLISMEEKKDFLIKIYKGIDQSILDVLLYLLEKNRIINIKDIASEFLKIYYEKNQILDVEGIFASEISEEQKENLIKNLEARTKKQINLRVVIDPSIIGGAILKVGDKVIDGSIKNQLNKLANKN